MKNRYSIPRLLSLCLCSILMLQSCLTENRDDCNPTQTRVQVVVRTQDENSRDQRARYNIENVSLYIFDGQNQYVGAVSGQARAGENVYETFLELDPGTYHFVVWTNQGDFYRASEGTTCAEELILAMQCPEDGRITHDIPDLHHGIHPDAGVTGVQDHRFVVILNPLTYLLNFTVQGLPVDNDEYSFRIRDNNSHYGHDSSFIEEQDEFEYVRTTGFTGDELKATIKTLRLAHGRSPQFDFSNITEGWTLHEDDLVEMIKKAYANWGKSVDFDTEYEFDIILRFDRDLGVTVTVNGWSYTYNPIEL